MNTRELTEAVDALMQREENRAEQQRRKRRRGVRRRRKELDQNLAKLTESIDVIKKCIVGILSIMLVSVIIVIMVVMEVEREVERIKGEVQQIQREAEMIRDKIRHPLESLGSTFGRQLEDKLMGRDQSSSE